jgi:hypothetical protein
MKKVFSVILAITLFFSMCIPAFAVEEAKESNYNGLPVIIVRGIDFAGLTYPDGTKALQVDGGKIISSLLSSMFMSDAKLTDSIFTIANDILSPLACDKSGNTIEDISMVQYHGSMANHPEFVANLIDGGEEGIVKTAVEKYGAENTYYFTYDWRKQPKDIATELHSFVEDAKRTTGKEKVNIICASMGGMVTTAYMYYFGTENINSAVYLSGAQNGTYVCGEALNGRIVFEKKVLVDFLKKTTNGNFLLTILLNVLNTLGVLDNVTETVNNMVTESFDEANDRVLRDCFGTLCGFWALCPDADFESGVQTIFGGHEDEYPVLLEKIEETKKFVFSTEETLKNAKNNGVKISFVSNYNGTLAPVHPKSHYNGDGVLETELTSNFAAVAPLMQKLSGEQMLAANKKYLSPDYVIDATPALFPDNTWFVKDAPHVAADYGTEFSVFTFTLLESNVQPHIDMFEEFPQFMIADESLNLSPLEE